MNKRYKLIRRVIITGKKEESAEAFDFLSRNGYRSVWVGPMPIRGTRRVDVTRFKIVADLELERGDDARLGGKV